MTKSELKKARRLRFEVETLMTARDNIKLLAERYGNPEKLPESYYKYCIKLDVKMMELMDRSYELLEAIEKIENPLYRELLQLYYIEAMKWEEVAERMGYCIRSIYNVHNRAIKKIREV